MNKFLDQILNPPPVVKRKSLSSINSQQLKASEKLIHKKQVDNFETNRIPSQQSNEEYEIQQQITEQVIFIQQQQQSLKLKNFKNQLLNIKPTSLKKPLSLAKINHSQSMPEQENYQSISKQQQKYVQTIKNHQNNHYNDSQPFYIDQQAIVGLRSSESASNHLNNNEYQQYQFDNLKERLHEADDNVYGEERCYNNYNIRSSSSNILLKQITVENLINGINQAKLAQKQLEIWFINQKYQFSSLFEQNVVLINKKINEIMEKTLKQTRNKSAPEQSPQQRVNRLYPQLHNPKKSSQNPPLFSEQQSLSLQQKWQIQKKLIKQQLQQRYQYRIQKLQLQLQQQRNFTEQRITEYQSKINNCNISRPHSNSVHVHEQSQNYQNNTNINQKIHHLIEELQFIKGQLQAKQKIINQLEIQNQKLNEHIFDVQQQIEGIQLEVQKRVKQRIKQYQNNNQKTIQNIKQPSNYINPSSNQILLNPILQASARLQQSSKLFSTQSVNITNQRQKHQQIEIYKAQILQLHQIIQKIQLQMVAKQHQLKQHQKILSFREQQILKNQQDINYQWSQFERQKNENILREQALTTAEENISKKITEYRIKEQELGKWTGELNKREMVIDAREEDLIKRIEEFVQKQNSFKAITRENNYYKNGDNKQKENSFIRLQRQSLQNASTNQMKSKKNILDFATQGGSFHPNGIQIPQLAIGKKYHQDIDNNSRFEKASIPLNHENQYQLRSKQLIKNQIQDLNRSYNTQKNNRSHHSNIHNYRQKQKMIVSSSNFKSGRGGNNQNQYVMSSQQGYNSKHISGLLLNHSRQKSRSKEKNLVRNHHNHNNSNFIGSSMTRQVPSYSSSILKGNKYMEEMYQNKQQNNLDGLGSKLERLRDQIKKEIDSIK